MHVLRVRVAARIRHHQQLHAAGGQVREAREAGRQET